MLQEQTTTPELLQVLRALMPLPELAGFRLVGGTALSLIKGHRKSVDIDLFTNRSYGTTDFKGILNRLQETFPIVDNPSSQFPALQSQQINDGLKLNIGFTKDELIKTDVLYWDVEFLDSPLLIEGIRFASIEEIGAMKLDVISRGGRKKDFWDLVEILEDFTLSHLLHVYKKVYPYLPLANVINGLCHFDLAEEVPDTICLRSRTWEEVKMMMVAEAQKL